MEKPIASTLGKPNPVFCVQTSVAWSHSHKSFNKESDAPAPTAPVVIYPLLPIENPTPSHLAGPARLVFWIQVLVAWSHSQNSLFTPIPDSYPVPIYPLFPMEKLT